MNQTVSVGTNSLWIEAFPIALFANRRSFALLLCLDRDRYCVHDNGKSEAAQHQPAEIE